jgi:UDP-N-acetylglucosamine--N-acetylmuramyl-(pentapeptide) pyrophosphoryl-undecaprenol N-acetylglucosamine transferase
VYPALAVLRALQNGIHREKDEVHESSSEHFVTKSLEILWIGGNRGIEVELLEREKIPYATIPAAGVHGVGWKALPGNLLQIFKGIFAAKAIIARHKPQVILFTGGYLAVPVAIASRFPSLLSHSPGVEILE